MSVNEEGGATPAPVPTDLDALMRHAIRLSTDLEKAWSSALDAVTVAPAHKQLTADWQAFLTALTELMDRSARRLEQAGFNARLTGDPPDLEVADTLEIRPDPQRRWSQAAYAHALAMDGLLQAVGAVQAPSGQQVSLRTGASFQWWEAGAFALVRTRALLVRRTATETDLAEAELLGQDTPTAARTAFALAEDELEAARAALTRGDPQGGLIHAHAALRARLRASTDESHAERGVRRPGRYFASAPSLESVSRLLLLLDESVDNLLAGDSFDLGVIVPLAQLVIPVTADIVRHPPEDLPGADEEA
jgi:hypothetical protein